MALATIAFTGFEAGDANENTITGTGEYNSSVKRTGAYSFRSNPTTTDSGYASIQTNDASGALANYSVATVYYRFYFRVATLPGTNPEVFVAARSASDKGTLKINSSGNILLDDSTITTLDTSSIALSTDTWYRIEWIVNTGTSVSSEVKIYDSDDATLLETLSGTGHFGTGNNTQLRVGKASNTNGETVDFYYDDVFVNPTGS